MSNQISVREKAVILILCIWSFLNTYAIIKNATGEWYSRYGKHFVSIEGTTFVPINKFYPFTYNETPPLSNFEIRFYDYSEYFVYVGGVWMIYLLYRYFKGNK
jgi:hypothetical protein